MQTTFRMSKDVSEKLICEMKAFSLETSRGVESDQMLGIFLNFSGQQYRAYFFPGGMVGRHLFRRVRPGP